MQNYTPLFSLIYVAMWDTKKITHVNVSNTLILEMCIIKKMIWANCILKIQRMQSIKYFKSVVNIRYFVII